MATAYSPTFKPIHSKTHDSMLGINILIIDDDSNTRDLIRDIFHFSGANAWSASTGQEGLEKLKREQIDLVLLDIMMPGIDGIEICRQIRNFSDVPIVLVSALDQTKVIIEGLDAGADDYVIKPFEAKVLVARVLAILRRVGALSTNRLSKYDDGYLNMDLESHKVFVNGKAVKLSATEFGILSYLVQNAGRVRTFSQILKTVWGEKYCDSPEYVHVYISQLRKKLEMDPKKPSYLVTAHRVGYRFVPNQVYSPDPN